MNAQEIISSGILELYATGAASEEEVTLVEQWVKQFPEVKSELDAIRLSLEEYALSASKPPSASVKEKIFREINSSKETAEQENPLSVASVNPEPLAPVVEMTPPKKFNRAAAVALVLLGASLLANILFYNRNAQLEVEKSQAYQMLSSARDSNSQMNDYLSVIRSRYSEPVALTGQQVAPDAAAKVFWIKNTGDVYIDPSNLPPVPSGKQYQFWAIVDGKPVDGGMIEMDGKRRSFHVQKMKSFGKADAFAITLEKEGGSPTPDLTQLYAMGKI